jgi:hypothetical protein
VVGNAEASVSSKAQQLPIRESGPRVQPHAVIAGLVDVVLCTPSQRILCQYRFHILRCVRSYPGYASASVGSKTRLYYRFLLPLAILGCNFIIITLQLRDANGARDGESDKGKAREREKYPVVRAHDLIAPVRTSLFSDTS